jgi:hypothetical protein
MKKLIISSMLFLLLFNSFGEQWFVSRSGEAETALIPDKNGVVACQVKLPGSARIYFAKERKTLRSDIKDFNKSHLSMSVKTGGSEPVRGHLFVKDKDGFWFQSRREFKFIPGNWQTFKVDITAKASAWVPVGHRAAWDSRYAMRIQTAGVSLYGNKQQNLTIECRQPELTGTRSIPALQIINLSIPTAGKLYTTLEGQFELTREYFNPFDPDEIKIDATVITPSGKNITWPVFHTRNFTRKRHFTREIITPTGRAYWAFRFTPTETGVHQLRMAVTDNSTGNKEYIETPWYNFNVSDSQLDGFVKSSSDSRFFEFSSGKMFFPVGINIHTNIDRRSENSFKFGRLPDRGTYDYDEYFAAMHSNGVNAVEIWMASWSFAIEWNANRPFYHGLGYYNLANAWRLDHVLEDARRKGIYVHLVLDNHGKLSAHSDQEWEDNPFNSGNEFNVANGGIIKEVIEFFTSPAAIKLNRQRNRYIAGRWGASTNIFGIELWSEVDLVTDFKKNHEENTGIFERWHSEAASDFYKMDQGKHLLCTHICGDYKRLLKYRRIEELPEFHYIVGDAYRKTNIHFIDQMRLQSKYLNDFNRPVLITEYGGTSRGDGGGKLVADIHCGLWSSFFLEQAGTPFLWWHDYIHFNDLYKHYNGFAKFIDGIDLRHNLEFEELYVAKPQPDGTIDLSRPFYNQTMIEMRWPFHTMLETKPPIIMIVENEREDFCAGFAAGNSQNVYGWIYNRKYMFDYPVSETELPKLTERYVKLPYRLLPGIYRVEFYHTLTGKRVLTTELKITDGNAIIKLPSFKIDIAFKCKTVNK